MTSQQHPSRDRRSTRRPSTLDDLDDVIAEIEAHDERYGIHPRRSSTNQPLDEWDYLTGGFGPYEPGDYLDDRRAR